MPSQIFKSRDKTFNGRRVPLNVIIDDGFTRRSVSLSIKSGSSLRDITSALPLDVQFKQHEELGSWVTAINNLNERNGFGWQFYVHDGSKLGLPYVHSTDGPAFLGLDNIRIDRPTNLEWRYEYYVDDITVPEHLKTAENYTQIPESLRARAGCSGRGIKLGEGVVVSEFNVLSSEEINNEKEKVTVNSNSYIFEQMKLQQKASPIACETTNLLYGCSSNSGTSYNVCYQYLPFTLNMNDLGSKQDKSLVPMIIKSTTLNAVVNASNTLNNRINENHLMKLTDSPLQSNQTRIITERDEECVQSTIIREDRISLKLASLSPLISSIKEKYAAIKKRITYSLNEMLPHLLSVQLFVDNRIKQISSTFKDARQKVSSATNKIIRGVHWRWMRATNNSKTKSTEASKVDVNNVSKRRTFLSDISMRAQGLIQTIRYSFNNYYFVPVESKTLNNCPAFELTSNRYKFGATYPHLLKAVCAVLLLVALCFVVLNR